MSNFVLLYFTPIGIIHQNFSRIRSTTTEFLFSAISGVLLLLAAAKPKAHFQGFLGILEGQNGPPWAQNGLKTLV